MPRAGWPDDAVTDIASRRDALRQATGLTGADAPTLLEAALTELDAAIEAISTGPGPAAGPDESVSELLPEAVRTERRLLHAVFQQAPVPLFLLEQDGTIRRANNQAAALLGAPSGYATGKAITAFVDLPFRAAVQTQLAAVTRTGQARSSGCRLLTATGPHDITLAATAADLPGDPPVFIAAALPAPGAPGKAGPVLAAEPAGRATPAGRAAAPARKGVPAPAAKAGSGASPRTATAPAGAVAATDTGAVAAMNTVVAAMTKRLDMVTAVTRVLLDNSTFSEAVTLQRCARLLAGEIADWVIIDIERGGNLLRQFVAGPRDGQSDQLARVARGIDPEPDSVPAVVHTAGKSTLIAHLDDLAVLGVVPDGTPLLAKLGATSLISVPIFDGTTGYGTLSLARRADKGPFGVADLGLAEELGRHLAIALRVDRLFRHRSQVADALQASLIPARLPRVPGLEFASAFLGATEWQEISGDFYDAFKTVEGWAVAIGDVCGKGQEAAAMTAAARHAIRALATVHESPGDVLAAANEVLVAEDYEDRFVTAALAFLRPRGRRLQVRVGSCGHPGPAVVRADGQVEILEGDGLPLGLFSDIQPGRHELELGPGDVLFFYTDGVTEARGTDRSFFEDRLSDALAAVAGRPVGDIVRAVQELVTTFSSNELRDDVTILAVQVATLPDGLRGLLVHVLDDLGGGPLGSVDGLVGPVDQVVLDHGRPGAGQPGLQPGGARGLGHVTLHRGLRGAAGGRVTPAYHPLAKPAVGAHGQNQPDHADDHEDPAGNVDVEA
jgi:serine phosphatase RsbU (regulator of sigma subunit)/PAS domain-containing protein